MYGSPSARARICRATKLRYDRKKGPYGMPWLVPECASHATLARPGRGRTSARHSSPPLFFDHISVSLHGKSYPQPTGFHTFYVVRILITHAGSPLHALKSVRPRSIPRGPSHALTRHSMQERLNARCGAYVFFSAWTGIRRARPRPSTSRSGARRRLVRRGAHHRDARRRKAPVQHACGTRRGWVRLG